ncbi:histidine kinase N-terminal 7TM domain-containing diguanylate cyclase [Ideonella livida]|uniref:diguanylate cyclase n=1 Tax=Ideonella livida TaxID=2707176 RepID=A0A7C9PJ27_9BURK|nr:histidine kinase N-terminal 7TM domain-containing protein [Ideonella livida]NDY93176.1 diguanylate cyclase [Ideonella livida]
MPQLLPYALPSLLGMLICLGIATQVALRRQGPAWRQLACLGLAVAWWCGTEILWVLLPDADLRRCVAQWQYLGVTPTPVLWLQAVLAYTGRRRWQHGRRAVLLWIIPLATLLLVATNPGHGLVWQAIEPIAGQPTAHIVYGQWYAVHASYSYALVLLATTLIVARFSASPLYRVPMLIVLLGPLAVVGANLAYLLWAERMRLDPTPFGFALAFAALSWSVVRHNLFELVPMARGLAVECLQDGVMVLSADRRVVDLNPAARQLLGLTVGHRLGRPLQELLPGLQSLGPAQPTEVSVGAGGPLLEARITHVTDGEGRVEGSVLMLRDITEARAARERLLQAKEHLAQLNQELERLAHVDALTGLANRRRLMHKLDEEIRHAREQGRPLTVLLADLDHFKQVNDRLGHLVGDRVLALAGRSLAELVRPEDEPARYGGEEFAVLFPGTDLQAAANLAARMQRELRELAHVDDTGARFTVTWSMGLATLDAIDASAQDLLTRADQALYHTKHSGRDGLSLYQTPPPPDAPIRRVL